MNEANISQIDLNLLVIFQAVCAEKNTVRAAERLELSQPAISHALGRLRDLTGDRLFVRASRGLIPTPRALELERPVQEILERAEKLFFNLPGFDPKEAQKTFRIATTDYFEQVALPPLLKVLEKEAPYVTVISRPTQGSLPKEDLESGQCDFAIAGFYKEIPQRFFQQKLFQDDFVCIANKNNSIGKSKLSVESFAKLKHLIVSPQGDLQSKSKEILKKQGFDIHYVAGVTSFLSPGRILSSTDLVLTCPRRLALSFCEYFPVKIYELPFKIPSIQIVQVWHERHQDDAAHKWMRQLLRDICSKI